jgi:CBS domain containing-hemolysin-like protein
VSLGFCFVQFNHVYTRMALGSSEEAVTLRVVYAHDALLSGSRGINMLGVGAGAYVPWLERAHPGYPWYWYQPTHSIPLLLYTELGLVGVAVVVWVIATLVPRRVTLGVETQVAVVVICASIGVAMLADHFLWTLQQGRLLIAICLGIMAFCRHG